MILTYSDTHLRDVGSFFPYNVVDKNGLTKELNNIIRGFKFISDMILLHKPKLVIGLGDYFQVTEYVTTQTLYGAAVALEMVKSACLEVGARHEAINGNHDTLFEANNENQHTVTSLQQLGGYFNLHTRYGYINYDDNYRIAVIPYTSNNGKLYKNLIDAQANADLIAAHFDVKGCQYESGVESDSHINPDLSKPCLAGDIHLPQDVMSVHYCGSLVQHKFYQLGLDRIGGVMLFNPSNQEITRIPNTYSKHYIKIYDNGKYTLPPPDKALIQFVSSKTREEVDEILKGYEYMYVKEIKNVQTIRDEYTSFSLADPKRILRSFILEDKPEALDDYDKAVKENT